VSAIVVMTGAEPTMSSREIADLVGSRHDKVKQSIERLVERGVIVQPPMGDEPLTDSLGRPRTESVYRIGKRDSYVIVAQLSPEFTARLVDRWQELEAKAANPFLTMDRAGLLRLALESEEKVVALTQRVEADAPKVDVFDRLCAAEGSLCMRDAAKALQVRPIDLKNLLIANRWIYGRPGHTGWLGYQDRLQQGVLTHKIRTFQSPDGDERVKEQVRVTPKGLTKLAQLLSAKAQAA
jgi:phage regulator Rha-like protein